MKKCLLMGWLIFILFDSLYCKNTNNDKMEWFKEARFGMFIHWGIYSVLGGEYQGYDVSGNYIDKQIPSVENTVGAEWIMKALNIPRASYRNFAGDFTAANYDPEQIVKYAKDAGMKYIIITSKHHEGFCLFPTKVSNWNVTNTPAKKDLLQPLVSACKAAGLKIGFYFSQNIDWMHEGGMGDIPELNGSEYSYEKQKDYVENNVCPMLKEILTTYDIDILWYDIPSGIKYQDLANKINETVNLYKTDKLITNNRLSPWHEGDYDTPEQNISSIPMNGFEDERNWERCMTMDVSWGYTIPEHNYNGFWCSKDMAIEYLAETVSKGGNFLLNIGPDKEGNIRQELTERLNGFKDWMSRNSEAIYGTKANPVITNCPYGFFTRKETPEGINLYFLVRKTLDDAYIWPKDGKILIRGLMTKPAKAYLLATGEPINTEMSSDGLILYLPSEPIESSLSGIKMEFSGKFEQIEGITQNENGNILMNAIEATLSSGLRISDNPLNIGYWDSDNYHATWRINVSNPGIFRISGEIAAGSGGKTQIIINNTTVNGQYTSTGNYWNYEKQNFGRILLPKGIFDVTVSIAREDSGWNLKNILLEKEDALNIDSVFTNSPGIIRNSYGKFTLITGNQELKRIEIYTPSGTIISSFDKEGDIIPFEIDKPGMFILKLKSGKKIQSVKFIN